MGKKKIKEVELKSLRVNISKEANDKIEVIQAKQRVLGISLTKDETIDFIVKNFNENIIG